MYIFQKNGLINFLFLLDMLFLLETILASWLEGSITDFLYSIYFFLLLVD
jgi:hypothetical protein